MATAAAPASRFAPALPPAGLSAAWVAGAPVWALIASAAVTILGYYAPMAVARWRMAVGPRYAALLGLELRMIAGDQQPDSAKFVAAAAAPARALPPAAAVVPDPASSSRVRKSDPIAPTADQADRGLGSDAA